MDAAKGEHPVQESIGSQLRRECEAMTRYALSSGLAVPAPIIRTLEAVRGADAKQPASAPVTKVGSNAATKDAPGQLARIHEQLAGIIVPAIPRTVVLLEKEAAKSSFGSFLGPVPLVRRMMIAAMLSLVAVVTISLSPDVNENTVHLGLLNSDGITLLVNLLFLLAAASLGATFAALFRANRYVTAGYFDPKHESSYWMRYCLGLIAGIILAELIPLGDDENSATLTKPTLAMVGGFSASVVNRMLNRLVETVETLVRGRGEELIEARELAARVRMEGLVLQGRSTLAANLMHLHQQVSSDADPKEVLAKLNSILADVAPSDFGDIDPDAGSVTKPQGEQAEASAPSPKTTGSS